MKLKSINELYKKDIMNLKKNRIIIIETMVDFVTL